ncbi:MAG TPA: hypothetical protein VM864_02255 [Pyrinomonadaceae bacterium]|jgi:tetratricopeptide (TPR) repeat protein|nr:hypothetical protein [Pyrinomonadaceae bacterium]
MRLPRVPTTLFCSLALAAGVCAQTPAAAQRKPKSATTPPPTVCDAERAVALVQQQVAEARSFEKPVAQISVMTRAADLLWAYQEDSARAIFTEAFDLASKYFAQKGDESRTEGRGLVTTAPDQRFVVLRAIAKRDAEWSRRLAVQVAEDSGRESQKATTGAGSFQETGMKLIDLAGSLLPVDQSVATTLFRNSFNYPLTLLHARFLYDLAKQDQRAADALALEAVSAYAARGTTEDLSYLSVYVFAVPRNISAVRSYTVYQPPADFPLNAALQEAFVKALFARAETIIKTPDQFSTGKNPIYWETAEIYSALVALEPLVAQRLPAYSERLNDLRASVQAAIGERAREGSESYQQSLKDWQTYGNFDAQLERAERETNPDRKEYAYATAASSAKTLEQLERAESLVEKINDANARRQLLNWLNFKRAQLLAAEGQFDEAKRAAERVDELDQRAILHFEIARASVKKMSDKARAAELLDGVLAAAAKAPLTDVRARAQLGVAHLYAEFDGLRALEVLGAGVKTINQLKDPDLAGTFLTRRIEGKTFGIYTGNAVPGFSLENAFREAGPHDFEGALLAARDLADPALRATAVIGLAAHCLEESAKRAQPKKAAGKLPPTVKKAQP